MKKYCLRCGKYFNHGGHLKRHFLRRNKCDANILDIGYEEMEQNYENLIECAKSILEVIDCDHELLKEDIIEKKKRKYVKKKNKDIVNYDYRCDHCNKGFLHKNSYYRHKKYNCNDYKKIVDSIKNNFDVFGDKQNIIINTYNIEKIENNINQTIIINDFGKEDTSYLKDDHLLKILRGPYSCIQRTNDVIHFNKKHKENLNIKIPNKKEPYAQIFKDSKWCLVDKKTLINQMINKAFELIDTYYESEGKYKLTQKKNKLYKKFLHYYDNDPDFLKRITKDIELMIINKGMIMFKKDII